MTLRAAAMIFVSVAFAFADCQAQTLPPSPREIANISEITPLKLGSGSNDVTFWGSCSATGGDAPCHRSGKIYQFETQGVINTYYATMPWRTPSFLLPLEDEIPGEGENSVDEVYTGNMDRRNDGLVKGLQQHVAFVQGLLNGVRQTFFVLATVPFSTYPPEATRAKIDIYGFWGGSEPSDSSNPPGFRLVTEFTTAAKYCDAAYATLVALANVPPLSNLLNDPPISPRLKAERQPCP